MQAAEAALESAIGGHEQAGQVEQAATQALPALEQAVRAATQAQGEVDRALGEAEQGLRVNEANHANAGKALAQWVARRERLEAEQRQVAAPVTSQIEAVQEQMEQEQATLAEQEAEIAARTSASSARASSAPPLRSRPSSRGPRSPNSRRAWAR